MQIRELKTKEKDYQLGYRYEVTKGSTEAGQQENLLFRSIEDLERFIGKQVNTYYCVRQRYSNGNANNIKLFTILSTEKPENSYSEYPDYDEYHDYFEHYIEAKKSWDEFKEIKKKKISYSKIH